ncbi:ribonuclease H2 subunit B isoform X2 [Ambystoma mexicanum]|uniref:ribonuclease H2 subunit B isoform X2 n=1 Tax=Ambystoma mexicanum TaxID=8296 RepID=UPI0037E81181
MVDLSSPNCGILAQAMVHSSYSPTVDRSCWKSKPSMKNIIPGSLVRQFSMQAKFQPVDQLITDEDFPKCNMLINCGRLLNSLHHVTEEKEIGNKKFYKYSREKTLAWLKKKVDQTTKVLKSNNVCVGGGVQSATFIRSKPGSEMKEEDYLRYAHGLVSEYIPQDLSEDLSKFLHIPELPSAVPEPPAKKRKTANGAAVEAEEDYSKSNSTETNSKKPNGKMTAAQKSLAKVDKSGMKSISSFFSPKSKVAK